MDNTLTRPEFAGGQPTATAAQSRLWEIDMLRGIAVVLMVFYHLMWDLHFFGLFGGDINGTGWQSFARSIGSTFMLLMGASLTLTNARRPTGPQPYLLRGLKIFACGLVISAVTFLAIPDSFVIFGILHLLGLSIMLAYPFLHLPRWAAATAGLVCLALGAWLNSLVVGTPWLIWLGVLQAGRAMADYYPLLPWFGVVLLGVFLGRTLYPNGARIFPLDDLGDVAPIRGLRFLGRHSLPIYLLHQPILLGVLIALGYGTL